MDKYCKSACTYSYKLSIYNELSVIIVWNGSGLIKLLCIKDCCTITDGISHDQRLKQSLLVDCFLPMVITSSNSSFLLTYLVTNIMIKCKLAME